MSWTPATSIGPRATHPRIGVLSEHRESTTSQVVTSSSTLRPHKSSSCNTYGSPRKCCKQKTYGLAKPFRCNTCKKQGGGIPIMVNQDFLDFEILASPQGPRRSWPSESIPSRSQKADHGRPVTINTSPLLPDLFLPFNCRLSTSPTSHLSPFLRYTEDGRLV
jgi:hypothetical protein